jgi:predicted transcriptional regulator
MSEKTKTTTVNLPDDVNKQIQEVINDYGLSKTQIIRRALALYMARYKETGRP